MSETRRDAALYELVGDEGAQYGIAERCCNALMDTDPEFAAVRRWHPSDLSASHDKLFVFLSGSLGGLPLNAKHVGHVTLRARHLPYSIDHIERGQRLACIHRAIDKGGDRLREPRAWLMEQFFATIDWVCNKRGDILERP